MRKSAQVLHKGFTLVELLVVIAIIAILAAVVVLIINPAEILARGRDSSRLADVASLQTAINVAVQESTGSSTETLCNGGAVPCRGSSNVEGRNSNGTGWAQVNLSTQKSVSVPTLPIDPTNSTVYHYTYCSDGNGWEINSTLESTREKLKMEKDGGDDPVHYEVGSSLALINPGGSPCAY